MSENTEPGEAELMAAKLAEKRSSNLRTLHWTTTKPTVPGWYWYLNKFRMSEPEIRYISLFMLSPHGVLPRNGQWAGPIPLPE